jgi:predicted transcriptional regulator of viral defense system
MARERGESGEYVETITLDRVVAAIHDIEGPVVTTRDIAESLDCTSEAARQKLVQLAE